MNWYYSISNETRGPVTELEFETLRRQGSITPETLVWTDGMADWQPYKTVAAPALAPAPPLEASVEYTECSQCGQRVPASEVIPIEKGIYCAICKPLVIAQLREGGRVAPRRLMRPQPTPGGATFGAIFSLAWGLFFKHFALIAAVVVSIWLPLNLISSYMDYFVFDPDNFRASFKFTQFLDNFIGIIATAGVMQICYVSLLGEPPTYSDAMSTGAGAWGRMWWSRFLTALTLLVGFVLLIVPGIYLMTRLALVEPVAVCERVAGSVAMKRSFELTKGRFWTVFLLGLAWFGIVIGFSMCIAMPAAFVPALDHWIIDAFTSLVIDVVVAFGSVVTLSAYVVCDEKSEELGV